MAVKEKTDNGNTGKVKKSSTSASARPNSRSRASNNSEADKSYAEKRKREMELIAANRRRKYSIILFALGVVIVLFVMIGFISSAFSDEKTNLLDAVYNFFSGLFGVTVFFIGPIIIYVAVLIAKDKTDTNVTKVVFQLIGGIFLVSTAIQIIFVGAVGTEEDNFFTAIGTLYTEGKLLHGGGVISGPLSALLLLFGRVGAVAVIVLIIFVYIMFVTRKTLLDFFKAVKKPVDKAATSAKNHREARRLEIESYRDGVEPSAENNSKKENRSPVVYEETDEDKRKRKLKELELAAATLPNTSGAHRHDMEMSDQNRESSDFIDGLNRYNGVEPDTTVSSSAAPISESGELKVGNETLPGIPNKNIANVKAGYLPPIAGVDSDPVGDAINEFEKENTDEQQTDKNREDEFKNSVGQDLQKDKKDVDEIITAADQYTLPPIDILDDILPTKNAVDAQKELETNAQAIIDCLKSFGVQAKIIGSCKGPSVTRYELQPAPGVKISKITSLADDIALCLAAPGIRIEAPIPGKPAIGIEVPNKNIESVPFRSLIEGEEIKRYEGELAAVLGKSISGENIAINIEKLPHLLVAGTTGSGKSVCVNSIIMSILFKCTPDDVRFIMIDPKSVEFMAYNGIPHLLIPVVTDPKKAAGALTWAVSEMLRRYENFSEYGIKKISDYNAMAKKDPELKPMSKIVIFIDELADLMMTSKNDVEDSICRLAQMGRAAGIHLIIATQRPTVDVVTGLIKSNIPSRIALKVSMGVDSRTILDEQGADKLLGNGDMLFKSVSMPKPMRIQGCWISDKEVERVVLFIKNSFILDYDDDVMEEVEKRAELIKANDRSDAAASMSGDFDVNDDKLEDAIQVVVEAGQASTSALQRRLKLGYGRAARLIDIMEEMGIVGPSEGSKPRQVLMTKEEYYERKMNTKE